MNVWRAVLLLSMLRVLLILEAGRFYAIRHVLVLVNQKPSQDVNVFMIGSHYQRLFLMYWEADIAAVAPSPAAVTS